jgi:hypothetical protein
LNPLLADFGGKHQLPVALCSLSFQLPEFVSGDFFEDRHLITSFTDSFAIGIGELPVDRMFRAYDLFAETNFIEHQSSLD